MKGEPSDTAQRDALLPAVIDLIPAPIVIYQGETICCVNRALCELTGYERAELEGMNVWDIVHPDDRQWSRQTSLARQAGQDVADRYTLRLVAKSGEVRWIDNTARVFVYQGERAVLATAVDVTAARAAVQALAESEERFHALFQYASDYMIVTDLSAPDEPVVADCNEAACRVHGYTREEMIGMPMRQLDSPAAAAIIGARVAALKSEGRARFESEHVRKDGSTFPVEVSAVVLSMGGKPFVFAVERDLTERKILEARMLRSEKLESLGVLAGGIAHDFNNILTSVLGGISISRALLPEGSEAHEHLLAAEKGALAASRLTGQLLTFAKGGAPIKEPTNLGALIAEAVTFASHGASVEVRVEVADDLCAVACDGAQITQVLHNLVLNAVQATPKGGAVRVVARNEERAGDPWLAIEVRDAGEGIPEEHLAKIFDPYFTTKPQGSGLGLASTHSIVRRHGGEIEVESTRGAGTCFCVRLPALPHRSPAAPVEEPSPPMPPCGRVLVMDDLGSLRAAATTMLRQLGCRAVAVPEGREAIELFVAARELGDPFSVVILDLTVPGGLAGLETFAALREIDPRVLGIVSSGYSSDPAMARYRELGFAAVLRKPYGVKELHCALVTALGPTGCGR